MMTKNNLTIAMNVYLVFASSAWKAPRTTEDEPAAQVFLSYNWNVQDKVLELKRNLESMNIKCWMDTGNMVGGDDLKKEIDKIV